MSIREPRRRAWRCWPALLGVAVLLLLPLGATADDVGEDVRAAYDAARGLFVRGERAGLERALRLLDARKDEALTSLDYWELYARVWLGLDRDAETLWGGVVAERQARAPASTVFDLVHARLSEEPAERRRWIEQALRRSPEDLAALVAKAHLLLDEEEEDDADELLEVLLEREPTCEGALLGKARLALSDGLPGEAVEYLARGLEKAPSAALYYLQALAYQRMAQTQPDANAKALDAAARALGMEPNARHIELYDELLKATGDALTATKALKDHFARTQHPRLGRLLAASAFRAGDYAAALQGLQVADANPLRTAKGLATCHARLGQAAAAQREATKVLDLDSQGRLFAARVDLWLGDAARAQERLGALADEEARALRVAALAWTGDAAALKGLVDKEARTGSREGEALLVAWLQARLFEKLGAAKAATLREHMLEARRAACAEPRAQGGHADTDLGRAKTGGWPRRAVSWFRAPCGRFLKAREADAELSTSISFGGDDGTLTFSQSIAGTVEIGGATQHGSFRFNSRTVKRGEGNPFAELFGNPTEDLADFEPALQAFRRACNAWLDGAGPAADAACAEVLKAEPGWGRVRVLRALHRALRTDGDPRAEASDARQAVVLWSDDFELRRAVILLRAWAGDVQLLEEVKALAEREAAFNVRDLDAL